MTINGSLAFAGKTGLILRDGSSLNVKGLYIPASATLNITEERMSSGSLTSTGTANNAGIGGTNGNKAGRIIIHSGTITATGGKSKNSGYEEITIYMANTVTATGGLSGAGIGGGSNGNATVTINGGRGTAYGNGGTNDRTIGIGNGKMTPDSQPWKHEATITLGWTNESDYIKSCYAGTVTVAEGKTLLFETNRGVELVPSGVVERSRIQNEKLMPAAPHRIFIDQNIVNGTVTADKEEAIVTETVTLTVTPDEGYEIGAVIVSDAAVTLTDGVYTFIMPMNAVTVSASFFGGYETPALVLPASLTTIEESAFEGNTAVTSVELPGTCTSIGAYAFRNCASLRQILVPAGVTSIGADVFTGCGTVYVFGYTGSVAESYCAGEENLIFVAIGK